MKTFHALAQDANPKRFLPEILPWLHEAGNPYFDWVFGSHEAARERLALQMQQKSAEVSVSRVTLLFENVKPVGGFLSLGGADLARCRLADTIMLMKEIKSEENARLLIRLAAVRNLFPRVAAEEFYLSKVGVRSDLRRQGFGRTLVLEYLAVGRAAGFRRFRLDVWAQNRTAIGLYHSLGFHADRDALSTASGLHYISMIQDQNPQEEATPRGIAHHHLSSSTYMPLRSQR